MEQFILRSCIQGYYLYKDAWTSSIGETLDCEREAAGYGYFSDWTKWTGPD